MNVQPDIAIFSPAARSGGSAHGGITPVVCNLAEAFAATGRRVELLTFAPGDPRKWLPALPADVTIRNFGAGSRLRHLLALRRYLHEERPGVLLSAGQRPNLLAGTVNRVFHPSVPVVLSVHNTLTPGLKELGRLARALRLAGIRKAYPGANAIVCVSAGVAEDLAHHSGIPSTQLTVIHNPIVTPRLLAAAREDPGHPWFQAGQPPVILGAGRLTRQKDFSTLIRAFALLAPGTDCRLAIIGEGGERDNLERMVQKLELGGRVDLPGFAPNPMSYMARASLFVLSSAWEGFGNVLVEAMAAGTSVVSTDCPSGPREILLDGALGPLVPPGDPAALAEAIQIALERPTDSEALRQRADDFRVEVAAERYLRVLFPGEGQP
jgi:glycosyltransferase involved in cell wall biosynthesis